MKKALIAFLLLFASASLAAPDEGGAPVNAQTESQKIIAFLNQTIVWYRDQATTQQLATEPSDVMYANQDQSLAADVVRNSFDFARARALMLTTGSVSTANADPRSPEGRLQSLGTATNQLEAQIKQKQAQAEGIRRKLPAATGKNRTHLEASLSELESEIELAQTRRDTMRNLLEFLTTTSSNATGNGTLQSQVEQLAKTVPDALVTQEKSSAAQNQGNTSQTVAPANAQRRSEPNGILALITDLISLSRKKSSLQQAIDSTNALSDTAKSIRTPLMAELRALMTKGEQVSNAPDTTDPTLLQQQKKQLEEVTAQFKQFSAAVLPLGKQTVLLNLYRRTLSNWQASVATLYRAELKALILRLVALAIVIGLIAVGSEIWRRATFRYVQDTRRRYQFLLIRRIVVWIVIAIVIAFSFATELGTLATFAGLLTAGVAVALQNVILSVAGYFFLIGRYGVRVGDRVQVGGVTGDVLDIGLVRMHIMETFSGSSDTYPTGRVVAVSNAVVFQPNAGLFKQIPGTNFVWHELTLTLSADSNYKEVEDRLMGAVRQVYTEYQDEMEAQWRRMEKSLTGVSIREMQPESRLRLKQTGLEVVIRYPVLLTNANTIDDEMTRALLDAIGRKPRLKLVGTGTPNIQTVTETASVTTKSTDLRE